MPPSNSVIRRYTPPTCTLEILAQSSPLSRWMGKTVIKQLTFELHFDDPQLPEERRIPIRGDRDQLEILCDAVTNYVQGFLQQPPDSFWLSLSEPQDSSKVSQDSEFTDFRQTPLPITKTFPSLTSQIPGGRIYLEPGNYLTHNLYLGSLANQSSGSVIQLSLLQIFDLATALDEYSADVMALPNLNNNTLTLRLPAWAPIAAVMVLGVGLLPMTLQYANNNRQKQPQIAQSGNPQETEIALESSPSLDIPPTSSDIKIPDDLASPPLFGADAPLPTASLPSQPIAPSSPSFSSGFSPTSSLPSAQDQLSIFEGRASNSPRAASKTIPDQQSAAIQPNLIPDITQPNSQVETTIPQRRSLPPSLSPDRNTSPSVVAIPPSLPNVTDNGSNNTLTPSASPVNPQQLEEAINSSINTPTAAVDTNSFDRLNSQPITPPSPEAVPDGTLFDTVQVAEAREQLTKRWQPPNGFAQTLEYSVLVGVDGTVERILPLNRAAREYIESAGMPTIGQSFVSANKSGQNMRIRVVLSPDGKVQTFPENE
ncbi:MULTISPECIES: DUF4335 domain-containing protein [unclassified Anabaena]|uniref:DUF4335 domain-containing protein n=1 Tax=unclassified Anabaena TaxID=2619674 RepID=UPI0039C70D19